MEYPVSLNCDIKRKKYVSRNFRKIGETRHPFNCPQFNQICDLVGMRLYFSAKRQGIVPLVKSD